MKLEVLNLFIRAIIDQDEVFIKVEYRIAGYVERYQSRLPLVCLEKED